jgi:predicted YcjX-like family ATPase
LIFLFVFVMTAGIPGWLKAKCVDRAARILIRRVEAYVHRKLPVGERLTYAIRLVVTNLAESGELVEATALLHKMQELHVSGQLPQGPDQRAYYSALNAWRKSNHTQKQKHIAKLESTLLDFRG